MRRILRARLLASALVVAGVSCVAAAVPAYAQTDDSIGFESFQQQLAPYGYWLYSDRWGVVWQPADVPDDFRPYYSAGRWVNTDDYGWTWASDYQWGDIPFHYGRWVNDPEDGWLWLPGYTWSPGWVMWRTNDRYIGWMPMPPDENFLSGRGEFSVGLSFGRGFAGFSYGREGFGDIGGFYGYSRWYGRGYDENRFAANWVFLDAGHMADRDYRPFVVSGPQVINIIHQTRNVTNYMVVNNYVVNRSVNVNIVERASGRPVPVVRAAAIFRHPNFVTSVDVGQRVQVQMRQAAPRGMGIPHSAPPPPPVVVGRLSEHVGPRNGRPPSANLMTRAVVSSPAAVVRFRPAAAPPPYPDGGRPGHMAPPTGGPGGGPNVIMKVNPSGPNPMTGPGSETPRPVRQNPPNGGPGAGQPETGSNSMTGPGMEPPHHVRPGVTNQAGSGPGSSMTSPGTSPGGAPDAGSESMTGPPSGVPHRPRPGSENQQGSGPGSAMPPQGSGSNSMAGPGGAPPAGARPPSGNAGPPPPRPSKEAPAPGPQDNAPPPPHKKKEPKPNDQQPPG